MKQQCSIILGSGSPRRKELLTQWGLEVDVQKPDLDESSIVFEGDAVKHVQTLALAKMNGLKGLSPKDAVLTADTLVVYQSALLGKPTSQTQARAMLKKFSGQTHEVITGYVLAWQNQRIQKTVSARVTFIEITDAWLDAYVACAHWQDKAGGYGIQQHAGSFVQKVEGPMDTVIGLPMMSVVSSMQEIGVLK